MAFEINKKLKDLTPYEPICDNYKIRLDANESFLSYSNEIAQDIQKEISAIDLRRYPDPNATKLCESFKKAYHLNDNINCVAGNGSDELIGLIISSFCQKGDKVCVLENDFSMYQFYSHISENDVVIAPKNSDLTINTEKLIKTVNDNNCRILIFSNPCNPTSIGLCKDEVDKIIKNVNALVIIDEAYMDFYNQSILFDCDQFDNCIVLKTCSKALSLASIRLGFALGNEKIINLIKSVKSPYNTNSITQAIGNVILNHFDEIEKNIKMILSSKKYLQTELNNIFNSPENIIYNSDTNFIFVKTKDAKEIFDKLCEKGIVIRCFKGYLRITAGTQKENKQLISALKEII